MAETYKEMLKRAEKKGEGQTNAPAKSAVASVALPKGGSAESYINAIYDASKNARNAQLEAAYNKAESDIALARAKADASYAEAQRQTAGEAARQGANFREIANANGLNTGAGGQAALAMSNQMQNDMASLGRAKAQDMSELDRQKAALAQTFEQRRQQLIAENDYNRNSALYNEYVRSDENRRQQAQFDTQMNMQMLQMAMAERERQIKAAEEAAKKARGTGYDLGDDGDWSLGVDDEEFSKIMRQAEMLIQTGRMGEYLAYANGMYDSLSQEQRKKLEELI